MLIYTQMQLHFILNEANVLRLKLHEQGGIPEQSFLTIKKIPFEYIDLSSRKDSFQEAFQIMEKDNREPFQILNEPRSHNKLIKFKNDSYILSRCCCHLIFGGWGNFIIYAESIWYTQYIT